MAELPGIPGYEIARAVGEGAAGVVYRARSARLGRLVAIKVLRLGPAGDQHRERFAREAAVLLTIRHEALLPLLDADLEHEPPYLVLPWMEGGDLLGRIRAGPPGEPDAVQATGLRLAGALACLHARDILHRDVKPANVLLDERGTPWLADLGLGRGEGMPTLTGSGMLVGTPRYLAPELFEGRLHSVRADLFALGVTLVELACGRPLDGLAGQGGKLQAELDRIGSKGLAAALRRFTHTLPEDRPGSADEAVEVLAGCLAAGSGASPAPAGGETATLEFPTRTAYASGPQRVLTPRPGPSGAAASLPAGRAPPAPGPGRGLAPRLAALGAVVLSVLLVLRGRTGPPPPGPEPDPPGAGSYRDQLEDPAFARALHEQLLGLSPGSRERMADPVGWSRAGERLPALEPYAAWLAQGGPAVADLDDAGRARLAALDEEFEAQGLSRPFGPVVAVRPAPLPDEPPDVPPSWHGAARRLDAVVRSELAREDREMRNDDPAAADPRVKPETWRAMLSWRRTFVAFSRSSPSLALAARETWNVTLPGMESPRRLFVRWHRPGIEAMRALVYATLQAVRLEPARRDRLALEFQRTAAEGAAFFYGSWAYGEPDGILLGGPDSPAGHVVAARVLELVADVRSAEPETAAELRRRACGEWEAVLRTMDDRSPEGPALFGIAFREVLDYRSVRDDPEALAAIYDRLAAPRIAAAPGLLRACSTWLPGIVTHPSDPNRLRPLARRIAAQARTIGPGALLPEGWAALDQVLGTGSP